MGGTEVIEEFVDLGAQISKTNSHIKKEESL